MADETTPTLDHGFGTYEGYGGQYKRSAIRILGVDVPEQLGVPHINKDGSTGTSGVLVLNNEILAREASDEAAPIDRARRETTTYWNYPANEQQMLSLMLRWSQLERICEEVKIKGLAIYQGRTAAEQEDVDKLRQQDAKMVETISKAEKKIAEIQGKIDQQSGKDEMEDQISDWNLDIMRQQSIILDAQVSRADLKKAITIEESEVIYSRSLEDDFMDGMTNIRNKCSEAIAMITDKAPELRSKLDVLIAENPAYYDWKKFGDAEAIEAHKKALAERPNDMPEITVHREYLPNGKVNDSIEWNKPERKGCVGYNTRRTTDGGRSWWTSHGYVSDPEITTWSAKENANEEWSNRRRGFQVQYDFTDGYGPWSATAYLE